MNGLQKNSQITEITFHAKNSTGRLHVIQVLEIIHELSPEFEEFSTEDGVLVWFSWAGLAFLPFIHHYEIYPLKGKITADAYSRFTQIQGLEKWKKISILNLLDPSNLIY